MEEKEIDSLTAKYGKEKMVALQAAVNKEKEEREAKIKNGIKWGDENNPLEPGDYVAGVVDEIALGKDEKTEHLTFINIKGVCSVNGVRKVGYISLIANAVLKTAISQHILRTGNEVFIQFDGMKQGKNEKKEPYKLYSVKEIIEKKKE
jgi:hypothetical protein